MDDLTDVQVVISVHSFLITKILKAKILKTSPPNLWIDYKAVEKERAHLINQNAYLIQFLWILSYLK